MNIFCATNAISNFKEGLWPCVTICLPLTINHWKWPYLQTRSVEDLGTSSSCHPVRKPTATPFYSSVTTLSTGCWPYWGTWCWSLVQSVSEQVKDWIQLKIRFFTEDMLQIAILKEHTTKGKKSKYVNPNIPNSVNNRQILCTYFKLKKSNTPIQFVNTTINNQHTHLWITPSAWLQATEA